MNDDLFERLRSVDPATDDRIVHESRALGNVPGQIVESEPTHVRRFPAAARRKATLVAVAAVVVVAIALPLTLLRSLGDGGGTVGDDSGDWVAVGTLMAVRDEGIVYDPETGAFVIAAAGGGPIALSAAAGDRTDVVTGERAIYCAPSDRFVDPAGDVFGGTGAYLAGPSSRGLDHVAVRVSGGVVQVDPSAITPADAGDTPAVGNDPSFHACQTANGIPLEGDPGFAIPNSTELPPIAVALPQSGAVVQSPVRVAGSANVFEANVSIRVLGADGDVIAQTFTTATCGTGCRGDFSTQLEVPIAVAQPGTIQVFESSAEDGSMINIVDVPVTLTPGLAQGTSNVEGIWYDGDGAALPDGSPGVEGTVLVVFQGAGHCQWGSAAFMHLGWPLGTVSNSIGDWRQYVRDPRGLFDDGALHVGYLGDTSLPDDATDTGYHRGSWQLWVSPSQADDAVFVVDGHTGVVERWGRSSDVILCD